MRGWIPGLPDDLTTGLPPVKVEQPKDVEPAQTKINHCPVTLPWPFLVDNDETDAGSLRGGV